MSEAQEKIAARLRWQAGWCRRLGSPLYDAILEAAAEDVVRGGPTWTLLAGREHEPAGDMLALRLTGAVHRLVLSGRAPALAELYPSAGGSADPSAAARRFVAFVEGHADDVRAHLDRPVQTNEVGRCAALLGGFVAIREATGLPLSVLEIGASAGLNLRFDRYRYASGEQVWGDPGSRVRLDGAFEDATPPPGIELAVAERRGCDRDPLDPRSEEDRLTLMSYVWPDQTGRFELLRHALAIASRDGVTVERAGAAEWAHAVLADARPGLATVLFHSIVIHYLSPEEASALHATILAAGERATPDAPFAWLFMEAGEDTAEVRLTLWPGGEERLIAKAGYHAGPVRWLG